MESQPIVIKPSVKRPFSFSRKRTLKLPPLMACLIMDLIGMSSYLLPFIGEAEDVVWAPVSGLIFYFLFGKKRFGMVGGIFSFLEEILPGTDIIPTFTIAWWLRKKEIGKPYPIDRF
jgi:hypothetical protein